MEAAPPAPGQTIALPRARGRRERSGSPVLYDYGVIGNLHTAALVSRFGGVDWACFPRFASPSVFARILDARRGGGFDVAPVEPNEPEQSYLPSSNILLTRFFLNGGRQLDLLDFMPIPSDRAQYGFAIIGRIAEARGGDVEVRVAIDPRFQYGATAATWEPVNGSFRASGGEDRVWAKSSIPLSIEGGALVGRATIKGGERASIEAGWGDSRPTAEPIESLLTSTLRYWQGWVHPPTTPIHRIAGLWHSWVERSELVLKLLSDQESGAFVAAPTTSLPEWPGGGRNWDYRYVWIRDAAFCAESLLLLGHLVEAERFLTWVVERLTLADASTGLRVMYGAREPVDLTERELDHLDGFDGSKPVRVGNGAAEQFQLDIFGELMDAARLLAIRRPSAIQPYWPRLAGLADVVVSRWREPDHGIWEIRGPPRQYVHSKLMAWVALDRAADLAARFGDEPSVHRWDVPREEIRAWMLSEGYDRSSRTFVQAVGSPHVDAANLRIPLVGFLPHDDPRVRATVARIRRELGSGPYVYRYHAPDTLDGPEGTFLPAAFWLVECLSRQGQRRRAADHWRRLLLTASPLGLYPEEYDPAGRTPLGNFPQAFTHIALLRAAVALGATEMPTLLETPIVH